MWTPSRGSNVRTRFDGSLRPNSEECVNQGIFWTVVRKISSIYYI